MFCGRAGEGEEVALTVGVEGEVRREEAVVVLYREEEVWDYC